MLLPFTPHELSQVLWVIRLEFWREEDWLLAVYFKITFSLSPEH
jgi:hypothetical protein